MASKKTNIQSPENYDRFIDDKERRSKGQFYTPKLFADYAHKMISEVLGNNWKDEYVVWDNCCGTKNLTRDYKFKELYCSTLEKAELDISAQFNPEAESFVFDFLNEPIAGRESLTGVYDDKLPKGLKDALLENKPIVFLLNPPYVTSSVTNNGGKDKSTNLVNDKMVKRNIGLASREIYAQFLFRILMIKQQFNLTNCYIALFCKPKFITGLSFKTFRDYFLADFKYNSGILFQASNFADVSGAWGITFNIWKSEKTSDRNSFIHNLIEERNGSLEVFGKKNLYNIDNLMQIREWFDSKNLKIKRDFDFPNYRSRALDITEDTVKVEKDFIGQLAFTISGVTLSNVAFGHVGSPKAYIHYKSLFEGCVYNAVNWLKPIDWINDKDELLAPNELHPKFQEFVNDSLVFSIFGSGLVSLRQIKYHDKLWDIKNEFFWMSKSEIESLANKYNNDDCYNDAHTSSERFVYNKLQTITLSPEAKAVLDKASDIVRNTFKYRELFNQEHPEYQINNWDCGWYQIKALCKEYAKSDYEEFVKLYKKLADKMRPMVYTLGFLK